MRLFLWMIMSIVLVSMGGCRDKSHLIRSDWMDAPETQDQSLNDEKRLVSTRYTVPTEDQLNTHVFIAVHGFTASTYEWRELQFALDKSFSKNGSVFISNVLLGAHGQSHDVFEESRWQEWKTPILEEYNALLAKGYTSISFITASAGGTLVLDMLDRGDLTQAPKKIILVDTLITPRKKLLYWVPFLYPFVSDRLNEQALSQAKKYKNWYVITPRESILELSKLLNSLNARLKEGIVYSDQTEIYLFQALEDGTVDPKGAAKLWDSLRSESGGKPALFFIPSDLHVFTQLAARSDAIKLNPTHKAHQQRVFDLVK